MKKLLAILLVLALAMAPTTALASSIATPTSFDGDGEGLFVEWEDVEIFVFDVPTALSFDFVLDPQGLYGMTKDQIEALKPDPAGTNQLGTIDEDDVWAPLDSAGQVIFRENLPYVVNQSNRDAVAIVSLELSGDSLTGDVDIVTTPSAVTAATATSLFIGATFSAATITSLIDAAPSVPFDGDRTLPIKATAADPTFVFEAAPYDDVVTADITGGSTAGADGTTTTIKVERDKEYVGPGEGTQFALSGECNPIADWAAISSFDVSIAVGIAFDDDVDAITGADITGAARLKATDDAPAANYITYVPNNVGGKTATINMDNALTFQITASFAMPVSTIDDWTITGTNAAGAEIAINKANFQSFSVVGNTLSVGLPTTWSASSANGGWTKMVFVHTSGLTLTVTKDAAGTSLAGAAVVVTG